MYALNSQLQALQILTNDDEVENWSLSKFLLAVQTIFEIRNQNAVSMAAELEHHCCEAEAAAFESFEG